MNTLTRRSFLSSGAATAALATLPSRLRGQAADALTAKLAVDPMRPQFHLLPARNWMNDPNGPIYFGGDYHMFFQYNPLAATWGDMSWNHAISKDMVHWQLQPVAMTPTVGGYDSYGVFSGSALAVGKRVYQVYTGTKSGPKELATIGGDPNNVQESQCLAWSDDARLIHWTKAKEPIIPMPPQGMKITGFRDPSMWKQGDWYYMTVGAGEAKVGGCVLLYRSKAIEHGWEYQHKLTSGAWNGKPTQNPCDDGEMWECPDFFALDGKHLLIYSTLGKVYWQSGRLDEAAMLFHPEKTGLLDLDSFYAPKTQLDEQGRRILWGWIQERRNEDAMRAAGWSGMMSLPRVLNLDADGTLRMTTARQVDTLRNHPISIVNIDGSSELTLPHANGEVVCTPHKGTQGGFQLTLKDASSNKELLLVMYSQENHSMVVDGEGGGVVPLMQTDAPTIEAYIDGSVIELILGGRIGCTRRFYYAGQTAPDIRVRASGDVAVNAWTMKPISPNRLTTLA